MDPKLPHVSVEQCASHGGTVREPDQSGWETAPICIVTTPDADRACTDSSQCTGRCLFGGGRLNDPRPGSRAVGSCEPSNYTIGCFAEVRDGRLTAYMCQD